MKKYTMTLADGTQLENLSLNGNNYISNTPVKADMFVGNYSPVTVSDGETEIVYENAVLVQITERDDDWWFILREMTPQEIREMKIRSDIDYIAMMTGTDLEEA